MTPTATSIGLEALQGAFQRHLLDEPSDFAGAVAQGGRIGVERRLAIYHNAYRARLIDALRDGYGHTLAYLGDGLRRCRARLCGGAPVH
ncbi:MAG: putative DNA-binding domain-containing protein [Methylibium sp.]|nr:putative DNA-binding domain-containing protein [Methylibium sp.]